MSAEIWAIGGGKGGTGKSLITSGLAIYLADIGKKVTLIDADLGGANLHSILKIIKPKHSLTDFFEKKNMPHRYYRRNGNTQFTVSHR